MARKSIDSRKKIYKIRAAKVAIDIDLWLTRIRERLENGHLRCLNDEEIAEVRKLLKNALDPSPIFVGRKLVAIKGPVFKERRRAYWAICRILRKAGNRNPSKKAGPSRPILRRKREV